ncbi:MAG: hypothetical protein II681_07910 [Bacteroidaceae bacterium]|nr:hypothetical protein [Bacteroidaceae bacterium]MBQ3993036.1 hypothetical protein [Bacteroidaceae bacterium]
MKLSTKRNLAVWILLVAFVPAYFLSSLHTHPYVEVEDDDCAECVSHSPHPGHLTVANFGTHSCVFCIFLTLPYLCAPVFTLRPFFSFINRRGAVQVCRVENGLHGHASLRGPPAC